jgi:hypothetical protein
VNADPDPALEMNPDPDPGYTLKTKNFVLSQNIKLNFNVNKVTINMFIPFTLIFILFMPNYLRFFSSFLLFLDPLGSGSRRPIECGSETLKSVNYLFNTL